MTEAFSDDGQRNARRAGDTTTLDVGNGLRNEGEINTGFSVTAARSVAAGREPQHGHDQSDDVGTISEHQEEYDGSDAPGSIRDHEIRSENIQFQERQFRPKASKAYTVHAYEDYDDEASRQAHKSNVTKVPPEATVSNVVDLRETSRSVETFAMAYDRLYSEF